MALIESENELLRETMGWLTLRLVALQKIHSRKIYVLQIPASKLVGVG